MCASIAVAGAGIYGASIAIRLAREGHRVTLLDPLGILSAASAINQFRIHSGYHYPRSPETIRETLEARNDFVATYAEAIVGNSRHFYAIPRAGSLTSPAQYESVLGAHALPFERCRPDWMNFDFIAACYEVDEFIYDPDVLRGLLAGRIAQAGVTFLARSYEPVMRSDFDRVVVATYGLGLSRGVFPGAKYQVAEKILIRLPQSLHHVALVVVDGPFTAFDPYGSSEKSLFGSAKNTNHWTTSDPFEPVPERYAPLMNRPGFAKVSFTNFEAMRADAALTAPDAARAEYLGSRFTMRVVENSPSDRRTLYLRESEPGVLHLFSGKVVGAVKAASLVSEWASNGTFSA